MGIDWDLVMKIGGPLIGAAAGAAVKHWFEARPNVIAFLQHTAGVWMANTNPQIGVGTHAVVLRNDGNKSATNVRLGHAVLPDFTINPVTDHQVKELPGGHKEIVFPLLVPKKQLTIAYAYAAPLQWTGVNTHLEHDTGTVKVLNVLPTVQQPRWVRTLTFSLAGVGVVTCAYLLIQFVIWLYAIA